MDYLSEPLKPKTITTMKKHLSKKTLWLSLLSILALGFVFILAVGSIEDLLGSSAEQTKKDIGGGMVQKSITYTHWPGGSDTYRGKEDEYGRRQGIWTITGENWDGTDLGIQEVTYVDGKRTGSTYVEQREVITQECYKNDRSYPCNTKGEQIIAGDASAFQVLAQYYPWFVAKFLILDIDNEQVKAYVDTLETILDELGDDPLEFDEYYSDAIDSLTSTPYDSIIQRHSTFASIRGLEEVKNDEFRMATIDRHRSNGKTTYSILESTYPGYLQAISELEVGLPDFERFCHVNDSLMDGDDALYGPLDMEDIFFVDSVDARLTRAMVYILSYEDTTSSVLKSLKIKTLINQRIDIRTLYKDIQSLIVQTVIDSITQNAGSAAFYFMFLKYNQGDMIYRSVKEAWFNKREVVTLPMVFTELTASNSATSVSLMGEVLEDGGATVTSRGMVWADFYNPTTSDNSEAFGSGLGTFEKTLSNLIPGNTYYARSFATNSVGTAYGNCLKFTAGGAVGINEPELFVQDFTVYPNPASAFTTISFQVESSENLSLTFVNLKGQAVYHHDLGSLLPGKNRVELDLSCLPNGFYSCQLSKNGRIRGEQKILIIH